MGAEAGEYTYKYPRPGLTVDTCIIAPGDSGPSVLLIKRKHDPFEGSWALPGGFVDEGERLIDAAARELKEETSVDTQKVPLEQVGAYGDPGRDPRGWTVSTVYCAILPSSECGVQAADDAADAKWFQVGDVPSLAFDHKQVLSDCFSYASKMTAARDKNMEHALQQASHKLSSAKTGAGAQIAVSGTSGGA